MSDSANLSNAASIDRRRLLGWLGAVACPGTTLAQAVAPAAPASEALPLAAAPAAAPAGAPAISLRDYVRMRGALDDRMVVGFLVGRFHGVVDTELTPLFGLLSATFSRWRALPDGRFAVVSFEHAYYVDPAGRVGSEWRNPYTERSITLPVLSSQPSRRVFDAALEFRATKPVAPGTTIEQRVVATTVAAGERQAVERVRFVARPPAPARPYRYAELVTLRSPLAALTADGPPRVPCATSFASISSWRPWMEMGDAPGHLFAEGAGGYGDDPDALPAAWLEATRRLRPELLRDASRRLDAAFDAA